jgi:small subunit ribosomal protein S16
MRVGSEYGARPQIRGNLGFAGYFTSILCETVCYTVMVKIRLRRFGKRNTPVYRVVVADGRSPRDGRIIEEIGTYDPMLKNNNFTLNLDRVDYWLGVGAQASDTVTSFIKKARKAGDETSPEEPVAEAVDSPVETQNAAEPEAAAAEETDAEEVAEPVAVVAEAKEPEAPAATETSASGEEPEPEAPAAEEGDVPKVSN